MIRPLLASLLIVSGCTLTRPPATAFYQAEGVTVAFAVRSVDGSAGGVVAGELLAVEPGAYLIDAVNETGQAVRVVRVPMRDITRGSAFIGPIPRGEMRTVVDTPVGMRRVSRINLSGQVSGADLRALSRFPSGIPADALARLLTARVQTEVAVLDVAPIRPPLH